MYQMRIAPILLMVLPVLANASCRCLVVEWPSSQFTIPEQVKIASTLKELETTIATLLGECQRTIKMQFFSGLAGIGYGGDSKIVLSAPAVKALVRQKERSFRRGVVQLTAHEWAHNIFHFSDHATEETFADIFAIFVLRHLGLNPVSGSASHDRSLGLFAVMKDLVMEGDTLSVSALFKHAADTCKETAPCSPQALPWLMKHSRIPQNEVENVAQIVEGNIPELGLWLREAANQGGVSLVVDGYNPTVTLPVYSRLWRGDILLELNGDLVHTIGDAKETISGYLRNPPSPDYVAWYIPAVVLSEAAGSDEQIRQVRLPIIIPAEALVARFLRRDTFKRHELNGLEILVSPELPEEVIGELVLVTRFLAKIGQLPEVNAPKRVIVDYSLGFQKSGPPMVIYDQGDDMVLIYGPNTTSSFCKDRSTHWFLEIAVLGRYSGPDRVLALLRAATLKLLSDMDCEGVEEVIQDERYFEQEYQQVGWIPWSKGGSGSVAEWLPWVRNRAPAQVVPDLIAYLLAEENSMRCDWTIDAAHH